MIEWIIAASVSYVVYRALRGETKTNSPINNETVTESFKFINLQYVNPPQNKIVLLGKTGAGKSSTCNALLGKNVFQTNVLHGATDVVFSVKYKNTYELYDTPGLLDGKILTESVLNTIQQSRIVVYVTDRQLYRPELAIVKALSSKQKAWNAKHSNSSRHLLLYVNQKDVWEQTMAKSEIESHSTAILKQVSEWIDPKDVAFGASAPYKKGKFSNQKLKLSKN